MDEYAREIEHHVPYRDARRDRPFEIVNPDREQDHHLADAGGRSRVVSAARTGAGRTRRPAGRRWRSVTARLLAAYRRGIFPWYSAGQPVLWWSPNPREVLFPADFNCSRSLAKTLRNRGFEVTFDRDFAGGGRTPARRGANTPPAPGSRPKCMLPTATCMSAATPTASKCAWSGALVGGLYGVLVGRVFFGESMFSRERDASKVGARAPGGARRLWRDSN